MTSSSHGVMKLPIWSETTTTGPNPLDKHINDKFITVVVYPRRAVTIFPEPENGLDSNHRLSPWIVEKVGSQEQQEDQEQSEAPAPLRSDAAAKETEDIKDATQDEIQSKARFWSENAATSKAASSPIPSAKSKTVPVTKSTQSEWGLDKGSIAAVVIISILTFACLAFLGYWYVARECKTRRRRRLRANDNQFDQSSLTLGEEASKALDEFLMKDVEPERTSIMFSRSRSPSITYAMDQADRPSSKASRNSYEASLNSILRMDPLARESADGARPSFIISDLTDSSGSKTTSSGSKTVSKSSSSSGSKSGSTDSKGSDSTPPTTVSTATPRGSLQLSPRESVGSSTFPPTVRSSQLWATTSAETTEMSSLLSNDQKSPRSSLSSSYSSNMLPSSVSSLVPSYSRSQRASNASQSSGRYFVQNTVRSLPRMINDSGNSRRNHHRSYSSRSMTISPIEESPDSLGTAPPASMFRFSDAS
ncbi:hypothetical protein N7509_012396 [Penicillium cosmopolitanum]|uniref:Uncharacterized protein n=1 Tax=Penicillium cosmopolitanum TaxID=1131564 RepID=A0A9W9SJD6_9EURO|nr:uncharacterized protein N7509_012396 [Penicillium cosmopolitanum]KAJ5379277.1 hypothetical protein N7509_012396 [Penicillium cosmopolitanum]